MLACTRLPFAMAKQHQLPTPLARVHQRFRTPYVSILICAVAALLIALPGTFIYAVKITVITRVIVYASTCAALPILRRRKAFTESSSFKVPAGIPVSIICVAICFWLLMSSDRREARDVSIAIVAGLIVFGLTRIVSNSRHGADIKPSADYTDYAD
jgi:amino acid transporter